MRVGLAIALVIATPVWGCDIELAGSGVVQLESERYVVALRSRPAKIAVGEHFTLDIAACTKNGGPAPDLLRVDAWMPAHRHGMNYVTLIQAGARGHWRAEGLMFHMPGRWQFRVDLRANGATDRLTHDYQLD